MTETQPSAAGAAKEFLAEFLGGWRAMPDKWLFLALLAGWVTLFSWFGNSIMSYRQTPSLFLWLDAAYTIFPDDEYGRFIPFGVLVLFWWKRHALLAVPKRNWWPGLLLLAGALLLHAIGYLGQQGRISLVAFLVGVYALTGLVWGPRWLAASFFPFCLLAFCVPLSSMTDALTWRLRLMAASITEVTSRDVLGADVIRQGTLLFDPQGRFQYDVAAACSGIRSLTLTIAIAVIYAFVWLRSPWRRLAIMAAALPLAVAGNVLRLTSIIIMEKVYGHAAGLYVHENWLISLLPYVPAILGVLVIGGLLREHPPKAVTPVEALATGAAAKS